MSTLTELGIKYGTDKATYHGFTDFYERIFVQRKFVPENILEIGIKNGSSLFMWADYFPDALICGVDINPFSSPSGMIRTIQMDATDEDQIDFHFPDVKFDLIIDDGSHMTADQQKTFDLLFYDHLYEGGIYLLEDCHTSFLSGYINSPVTTFDWIKSLKGISFEVFQKDPTVFTDSITIAIFKL